MLIYRHKLIMAENGGQRRLEAEQRHTGGRPGVVARTETYETVIDCRLGGFGTLPPTGRRTIKAECLFSLENIQHYSLSPGQDKNHGQYMSLSVEQCKTFIHTQKFNLKKDKITPVQLENK